MEKGFYHCEYFFQGEIISNKLGKHLGLFIMVFIIIGILEFSTYNRHPSILHTITNLIAYLSNHAQQFLEYLWLHNHITVTAYNWWCHHNRLILEDYQNLFRNKFISMIKDGCYYQGQLMTLTYMNNWQYWGDNSNNL